ncbi:MAG: 5-formyltetrahydrofolate cyclo-ligase [Lachnospiraceae bacterium]|nr:5-formyltetrahydrofolate cyclo-ligase [Lachnospiraceae bacterium]
MNNSLKSDIRKKKIALRDSLSADIRKRNDKEIHKRVLSVISDVKADTILIYVSFRSEADTYGLINELLKKGIKVAVPKVEDKDICFYYIDSEDDLQKGYMGIYEPKDKCLQWEPEYDHKTDSGHERTMVICPGSVFDRKLNRTGYGGGFYDRFLSKYPDMYRMGICYECQMTDNMPADEWDIKMDVVINEQEIISNDHKS